MDIKEMVFYVTETKTYEVVINKENGFDMPETAKELVEHVNSICVSPYLSGESFIDSSIEVTDYEIKENK